MITKTWQDEAMLAWKTKKDYNGTIKAPTGTGKSYLAILGYRILKLPMVVIVPLINLKQQWEKDLILNNVIADVVVINTARKNPEFLKNYNFIVLDEIHHYASEESRVIFDYMAHAKVMGLSATPERQDGEHAIFESVAPIVYDYHFLHALKNKDISKFKLINIPVELANRDRLNRLTEAINRDLKLFNFDLIQVHEALSFGTWQAKRTAGDLMRRIQDRKKMLIDCDEKNNMAVEIVFRHEKEKVMIFTEIINSAVTIFKLLTLRNYNGRLCIYHSGMKKKDREAQLQHFKEAESGVLISAKALDEGVNIPSANVGIIVGGSSVKRQFIQRLGRLLRQQEGKEAVLYQLFVPQSKDEEWMNKRSTVIRQYLDTIQ